MTTQITIANLDSSLSSILPTVSTVSVCDASGTVSTDLALRPAGGYLKISGSGFITGCILYVNGSPATATTVISPTEVRVQMPALAVGTYSVMLFNTATVAAIWVAGVIYSAAPVWSTTAYNGSGNVVNAQLVATGDVPLVYSLQAGSSLPTGVTLSSTGLISGTATAITSTTTVTFTVAVSDLQLQSTPQLITLTMTFYVGKMWVWGQNYKGQLGLNDTTYKSSPVQVGTLTTWKSRAGGGSHYASAIRTDGTLWAWGNDDYGVSGIGTTQLRSSPTQVGALTDWDSTTHRDRITLAIKTNGTLWAWGLGNYGTLGQGDINSRSSPVQIGALTNWKTLSSGGSSDGYTGAAIKTNGTLWTWGENSVGQLGLSNTTYLSSPVQVGLLTNWSKLSAGSTTFAAIKTDGTLWTWGSNSVGKLGLGDTINKNSPVQVGVDTNWSTVAAGVGHMLAIKTDGTLWAWGSNYYTSGQLGLGNTISRSSPMQVGSMTNWLTVSAGQSRSGAIKTDGTLWMWGSDGSGAMGQNATGTDRSSPIQVGSLTTWQLIDVAGNHVGAISA